MIIGNHELKGSAISLREPFAVLRKRKRKGAPPKTAPAIASEGISHDHDASSTTVGSTSSRRGGVRLEVVGIVRRKLMFDQYPKSIMRSQG